MIPENLGKPTAAVRHSDLERSGGSAYKSECPVCKGGVLLIRRDGTMRIVRTDICSLCGQTFRYLDQRINGEKVWEDVLTTIESSGENRP